MFGPDNRRGQAAFEARRVLSRRDALRQLSIGVLGLAVSPALSAGPARAKDRKYTPRDRRQLGSSANRKFFDVGNRLVEVTWNGQSEITMGASRQRPA
jgi:hypothetical protein